MNRTLKIRSYQDSLGNWHAVIDDAQGNSLVDMPRWGDYGLPSEAAAFAAARGYIAEKTAQGIDLAEGWVGD